MATSEAIAWRARLRSYLGGVRNRQGRWREAISACRLAIAEAESVNELPALAQACYALDWALVESGRLDEANYSWRALEIYQQLGDLEHESKVLNNLGGLAYFDGRWNDAVELYRRAGSAGDRAGQPLAAAYADGNVGEILSDQGHLDEAEIHLQRSRRVLSATGARGAVAFSDGLLGRLYVRRGEYERGLGALTTALEEVRKLRLDAYAEDTEALLAEAHAFGGDPFEAFQIASRTLQANDRQRPLLSRVGAIALARAGQKDASLRELGHSLRVARERGAEYEIAATIDMLDALAGADRELLAERDRILDRLKIVQLPRPADLG
jgi:tetratricopeptide (TPR) repeat protein